MNGNKRRYFKLWPLIIISVLSISALSGFLWGTDIAGWHLGKVFASREGFPINFKETNSKVEVPIQINNWGLVSKTDDIVQLDGLLDDAAWNTAVELNSFTTAFYNQPAQLDTAVQLLYDRTHLYIGMRGSMDEGELPETERVFIVLRPHGSSDTFYTIPLVISEGPHPIGMNYRNSQDAKDLQQTFINLLNDPTVGAEVIRGLDGNWTAELAIPFSALGVTSVNAGEEWGINILRYFGMQSPWVLSSLAPLRHTQYIDGDYAGESRSYTLQVYLTNEGRLSSLFFDHLPHDLEEEKPTVEWRPALDPQLFYHSYTDKSVLFAQEDFDEEDRIRLTWISPSGSRTVVSEGSPQADGQQWRLSFTHPPAKEEGLYRLLISVKQPNVTEVREVQLNFDRYSLITAGDQLFTIPSNEEDKIQVQHTPPSDTINELLALIPDRVGFSYTKIPHAPSISERNKNYSWNVEEPWVMVSTDSQQIQYPNAQYPEDKKLTVVNSLGEEVDYPYYEDAAGQRYFLSAHLWYLQRNYVKSQMVNLAITNPLGAARLLYRFAQVYDGWVPVTDQTKGVQYPIAPSDGPPYNYYGGMWSNWSISELRGLTELMNTYAVLKRTNAFELLSAELGVDVERKIVEEMFEPSIEFVHMFADNKYNQNVHNYTGLIYMARALGDPKYMHEAVEKLDIYAKSMFMLDGFWKEATLSYHADTINLMNNAINLAAGWSDPVGYESPRTGERFDDLDLLQRYPSLRKMVEMRGTLAYPDGSYLPLNETWVYAKVPPGELQSTESFLKPAAGIAKLIKGIGSGQSQLYMTYSPMNGHDHNSPLNLILYAKGQELLPDLGYTHTKYRNWTASTLAHNTVVVNGRNSAVTGTAKSGGNISQFSQLSDGVDVVHVEQRDAYQGLDEYGREPWFINFNGANDNEGYVVDLFRVAGGKRHEYTLNGDANRTAFFETNLPLTDYGPYLLEGDPVVTEPVDEYDTGSISDGQYLGYMYVRDVQSAPVLDGKFELTMRTEDDAGGRSGLKITGFINDGDNELFIGKSPSICSTRTKGTSFDTHAEAEKYFMPKMVLRREGTDLKSNFVTIMEPLDDGEVPKIEQIEVLMSNEVTGEVAVSITYGNTQDIILSAPNFKDQPLVVGDLRLEGKMGFIRLVNGEVWEMRISDGTRLQKGDHSLSGNGSTMGSVINTLRKSNGELYDAFVTEAFVPSDVAGRYMIVTHPDQTTTGYKILEVRNEGEETLIVLDDQDPGFDVHPDGRSELQYYPMTSWDGAHTFRIANVDGAEGVWPIGNRTKGTISGEVYSSTGLPLDNVSVNLTGYSISTSTNVAGVFTLLQVPSGWQRVTAIKQGYTTTVSDVVYVPEAQSATVILVMADQTFPLLTHGTSGGARLGESFAITSSKDGYVYLVPDTIDPVRESLDEVTVGNTIYGVRLEVSGNVAVELDTSGLAIGRYMLYAMDHQGRISAGSALFLIPFEESLVDSDDSYLHYSGRWFKSTDDRQIGGSDAMAQSNGSYVDVPFYGTGAKIIGKRSHEHGQANIYLDGTYLTTVDNYSPSWMAQQVIYDTGPLPEGFHILRYERAGQKDSKSSNYHISFDALQVTVQSPIPDPVDPPVIHGVEDGGVYNSAVTITINHSEQYDMTLNGTVFENGETVSDEGEYILSIRDVLGNETLVSFKIIIPNVPNVTPNGVRMGEYFTAASSKDGYLYLVPDTVEPVLEALNRATVGENVYGIRSEASRDVGIELNTGGLPSSRYMLYAVDLEERVSAGVAIFIISFGETLVDSDDTYLYYSGKWYKGSDDRQIGGSDAVAQSNGSYVDIPFYGIGAKIIGKRSHEHGQANIYLDGTYLTTVDNYSPSWMAQQEIYDTGPLPEGFHIIRYERAGQKDSKSSNYLISFDALQVTVQSPIPDPVNPPVVHGVEDGGVYNSEVTITINHPEQYDMTLNGVVFENGETVSIEGEYVLSISDVLGNETILTFKIVIPDVPSQMLEHIMQYQQAGEIETIFSNQLIYRVNIIQVLLNQEAHEQVFGYMNDFLNYINDPSVQAQQLISEEAAAILSDLIRQFIRKSNL